MGEVFDRGGDAALTPAAAEETDPMTNLYANPLPSYDDEADETPSLVGNAPAMLALREAIERFGPAPYPVLVEGESGVGKELVARALHTAGPSPLGPFVAINCGALCPEVIESELFGHERGAFTGALGRRRGVFEEAHGGTLFLDEVGELGFGLQARLLRVLETGEIRRVGGEGPERVRVRVVSATLRDLAEMVAEKTFREDLYYRLADLRVTVAPLRDRRPDIPALTEALLSRIGRETGRYAELDDLAMGRLLEHPWPGNVRELLSVLKRAVFLGDGKRITEDDLRLVTVPRPFARGQRVATVLHDTEDTAPTRKPIEIDDDELASLFARCEGNVTRVASITGLARSTLRARLARSGRRGMGGDPATGGAMLGE